MQQRLLQRLLPLPRRATLPLLLACSSLCASHNLYSAALNPPQMADSDEAPTLLGPGEPVLYLPRRLYTRDQVSANEEAAAKAVGSNLTALMDYAGQTAYSVLCRRYPAANKLAVLCGQGNNGGDGYVLATLARRDGKQVMVAQVGDQHALKGDALRAMKRYVNEGGVVTPLKEDFVLHSENTDIVVDALFGIGLTRSVKEGPFSRAIQQANACGKPVLAIDIPSGLAADSGQVLGFGIRADATVTFVGMKQGLFTGHGPEMTGSVYFGGLGVQRAFESLVKAQALRYAYSMEAHKLLPLRKLSAHKGNFGKVVLVGGDTGMSGAIRMSAEAALRTGVEANGGGAWACGTSLFNHPSQTGAGLLKVVTHKDSVLPVQIGRPELMVTSEVSETLKWATVIAVGPGMASPQPWSADSFDAVMKLNVPMVVDGGGLGLLAERAAKVAPRDNWVLTPHPGEAGQLLNSSAVDVENDRFAAVRAIQKKFGGVVLLKGSGTLVSGPDHQVYVISEGNPGMATGGMGDTLTGIITGLLAQGLQPLDAARLGASIHGAAADLVAAEQGERGMAATDLLPHIIRLVNPSRRLPHVPYDPPLLPRIREQQLPTA